MFDWFKPTKRPLPTPPQEYVWKSDVPAPMTNLDFDKVVITANTEGAIKMDFNGYNITIPGGIRHMFMAKLQKAVQMADVADPDNEPLNKALT